MLQSATEKTATILFLSCLIASAVDSGWEAWPWVNLLPHANLFQVFAMGLHPRTVIASPLELSADNTRALNFRPDKLLGPNVCWAHKENDWRMPPDSRSKSKPPTFPLQRSSPLDEVRLPPCGSLRWNTEDKVVTESTQWGLYGLNTASRTWKLHDRCEGGWKIGDGEHHGWYIPDCSFARKITNATISPKAVVECKSIKGLYWKASFSSDNERLEGKAWSPHTLSSGHDALVRRNAQTTYQGQVVGGEHTTTFPTSTVTCKVAIEELRNFTTAPTDFVPSSVADRQLLTKGPIDCAKPDGETWSPTIDAMKAIVDGETLQTSEDQ